MIKRKIILLWFLFPFFAQSQKSDFGNWLIYIGSKKIDTKLNWHHEVQYRNYNAIGDLEQLLLRTGIGYNLAENNHNILLGYGYINSQNYLEGTNEKKSIDEHRVYQQYTIKQKVSIVKIQHRYRFEQRLVNDKLKFRFRYFLSLNIPLNNKELIEKTSYLSIYNELFINSKSSIFDRNRLYGGIGYKLNSKIRFELGYLTQFYEKSKREQLNIIAFMNF